MIILLAPAKTMIEKPIWSTAETTPVFIHKSQRLVTLLRTLDTESVQNLMKVSPKLADETIAHYHTFNMHYPILGTRAIDAYQGDVYKGLAVDEWSEVDIAHAQRHLRILSAVYGWLRPLDIIKSYRLEMHAPLKALLGETLYQFWHEDIQTQIAKELSMFDNPYLVNVASDEFTKVIHFKDLAVPVYQMKFYEWKNNKPQMVSFFAKRARGLMAAHLIKHMPEGLSCIERFNAEGYTMDSYDSSQKIYTFIRR